MPVRFILDAAQEAECRLAKRVHTEQYRVTQGFQGKAGIEPCGVVVKLVTLSIVPTHLLCHEHGEVAFADTMVLQPGWMPWMERDED